VTETGHGRGRRRPAGLEEVAQVPHLADQLDLAGIEKRDARRVVAPVLETAEAVEDELLAGPVADVSDDPAHGITFR
jgi:hypothetical protein